MAIELIKDNGEILAPISPVYALVSMITEDTKPVPSLLVDGMVSPHSFSLKPSDMRQITEAKIIFVVDEDMESFLAKPLANTKAEVVYLSKADGMKIYPLRGKHNSHNNMRHTDNQDVHLWLDTDNAKRIIKTISEKLTAKYPENALKYKANEEKALAEIQELQIYQDKVLRDVKGMSFLVYHDGWQYYEKQNGLKGVGSVVQDDEVTAGIKTRLKIKRMAEENNVKCLFIEPQFDSGPANSLAQDLGLKLAVINPLINLKNKSSVSESYIEMMKANTDIIKDCLSSSVELRQ